MGDEDDDAGGGLVTIYSKMTKAAQHYTRLNNTFKMRSGHTNRNPI